MITSTNQDSPTPKYQESLSAELHYAETPLLSFSVSLEVNSFAYSLHYLAGMLCLPHPIPSLGKTG